MMMDTSLEEDYQTSSILWASYFVHVRSRTPLIKINFPQMHKFMIFSNVLLLTSLLSSLKVSENKPEQILLSAINSVWSKMNQTLDNR